MGRRKLRTLLRIFRDRISLIRASLSLNRAASTVHVAVLRATSVSTSSSAPSDRRLSAVLRYGHGSRITARFCVATLMDRLHSTTDATVALRSLITIHALISRSSSFILRDELSFFPSSGGRNHLNLSSFRDDSDAETWELSSWVRWYAEFLDQTLIASRTLGYFLISPQQGSDGAGEEKVEKVAALLNPDLLREIDVLVSFIELVSNSPESVDLQRNNLIYEVVRLVCDDYGIVRGETFLRLVELGDRLDGLTHSEVTELLGELDRIERCKEKLFRLFGNKKNGDGLWDTVTQMKMKGLALKERMEGWKLVRKENRNSGEQTQFRKPFVGLLDSVPLAVSTVG
ncbi:putative clathrin assembly protein At4g40080 [Punica granatum]|uniref:ENTH domain-containing protein n=2 Tax=Punica granatum TaxID=22663 RepID=A0A218X8I0_PUNGR|nr:putative clathrin assembly protein At4g40080 [Punica granatum]OWM80976.1 hypothetical protein CDL15_Pgr007007 [Punica granatum]PKI45587.1 hypothetical protein CRG98_033903 [Punica granatum]